MQTFVFPPDALHDDTITIIGAEARHIAAVLRLGRGDLVRLIDGSGMAYQCEIRSAKASEVICGIIKSTLKSGEPPVHLTLAIGLSTGTKFDTIIEKGTEVGISRFVPLLTDKGKVSLDKPGSATRKLERWKRVALAAVKQSGRSLFPQIDYPTTFTDFLNSCDPEEDILFHPGAGGTQGLSGVTSAHNRLGLIVGPESGFSSEEIDAARHKGIRIIDMGDRVLRTETAGIIFPALAIYCRELTKE